MSRKASPTLIGGFVVGAAALTVFGVVVLGSGRFFQKSYPFVAYFQGDVNGLSVGAPVKFKGVTLGAVTHIFIQLDQTDQNARVPVYFELDVEKLDAAGVRVGFWDLDRLEQAIQYGLRAQLQSESLVTGVLFVQLSYHPRTAVNLIGTPDGTPEIPTLPTQIEQAQSAIKQIIAKLDEIDFKELIDRLTTAAEAIGQFASSKELKRTVDSLDETLKSIRDLSTSVEKNMSPLVGTLKTTAEEVGAVGRELEQTLATARTLVEPEAPLAVDLRRALGDLRDAARSIQSLADELDRNPSSLVFGRETERREEQ